MKRITFKNPVKINCNFLGYDAADNYGWHLVECDAVPFPQSMFNGHSFYIAACYGGYRLIEYSTGITIGGSYPDKTPTAAAKWFAERVNDKGTAKIVRAIQETLVARGRANGDEKEFQSGAGEIKYSALIEIACDGEIFDLDTIPVGSTYYLENGETLKRIL